jgi:ABC-type glutathione transport system ATPase component
VSATRPLSLVRDPASSTTKLELRHVAKSYVTASGSEVRALDDVSFDISAGEFV